MSSDNRLNSVQAMTLGQKMTTVMEVLRGFLLARHFDQKHWILARPGVRVEKRNGEIHLGNIVGLGTGVGIAVIGPDRAERAVLSIGTHTHIQDRCHINCYHRIAIGSYCAISWDVEILDTDIHTLLDGSGQPLPRTAAVVIEDHVWIGARVIVLKGVTIGHDSVIAAGAVVTKSVPPYSLCAGNPARVVKTIRGWAR